MVEQAQYKEGFLCTLESDINSILKDLYKGIYLLSETIQVFNYKDLEGVPVRLTRKHCDIATSILQFILEQKGYDTEALSKNFKADEIEEFGCPVHKILIVTNPDNSERIVVDPTYLQFLMSLSAEEDFPEQKVLIVKEDNLKCEIEKLAKFYKAKIQKLYSIPLEEQKETRVELIRNVFNLSEYLPVSKDKNPIYNIVNNNDRSPMEQSFLSKVLFKYI